MKGIFNKCSLSLSLTLCLLKNAVITCCCACFVFFLPCLLFRFRINTTQDLVSNSQSVVSRVNTIYTQYCLFFFRFLIAIALLCVCTCKHTYVYKNLPALRVAAIRNDENKKTLYCCYLFRFAVVFLCCFSILLIICCFILCIKFYY